MPDLKEGFVKNAEAFPEAKELDVLQRMVAEFGELLNQTTVKPTELEVQQNRVLRQLIERSPDMDLKHSLDKYPALNKAFQAVWEQFVKKADIIAYNQELDMNISKFKGIRR